MHAIALKASVNLLHAYMSEMIQEEEDSELASLIGAQITGLQQQFVSEMQRFIEMPSLNTGEQPTVTPNTAGE